jgi:hypothetical protein
MAARGREQVGLEADVEEDRVGVEARRERRPRRRVGVDAAERRADGARGRAVGVASAQQLFPEAVLAGASQVMTRTPRRSCWPSTRGAAPGRASLATSSQRAS